MAFTREEQARLGDIYAPILFLRRDDVAPISPAEYVRRSALWPNGNPAFPDKLDWGSPATANSLFHRVPDLNPGTIAASATDPDLAARTLLSTHISGVTASGASDYFLDHGGWDDQPPGSGISALPLPGPGEVTETSENLMGSLAMNRWRYNDPLPELDQHIGWYSVQAFDTGSFAGILELNEKLTLSQDPFAKVLMQVLSAFPAPSWLIFYHLLFPACSERVSMCEFIATMHALGLELPPEPNWVALPLHGFDSKTLVGHLKEAGAPYSLPWAGYLGQFVTVGVVAPIPLGSVSDTTSVPTVSPVDVDDDQFAPPLFVGFGRSAAAEEKAGVPRFINVPLVEFASADELMLEGRHPKVFVSNINHNLYPQPGEYPRPVDLTRPGLCARPRGEPPLEVPLDEGERKLQLAVAIFVKLSSLGFIAGAIAAVAEAIRDKSRGPKADVEGIEKFPQDSAAADPDGLILAPADLVSAFADEAAVVRAWAGSPEQRVFDSSWEASNLSWGPPALQDPFLRRQGQSMPGFLGVFIAALGAHLEVTSE